MEPDAIILTDPVAVLKNQRNQVAAWYDMNAKRHTDLVRDIEANAEEGARLTNQLEQLDVAIKLLQDHDTAVKLSKETTT